MNDQSLPKAHHVRLGNYRSSATTKAAYMLLTALLIGAFLVSANLNNASQAYRGISYDPGLRHYADYDQYARLADSLLKGDLTLDLPVPDSLSNLDDPYEFAERDAIQQDGAIPIFWDHAFYKGSYYCYFGVVPAVLIYLPYQAITGSWLSTPIAVSFLGSVLLACSSYLIWQIARRFFPSTGLGSLVYAGLLFFAGSNVVYLGFVPTFYSIPILFSLCATMLGLGLWIASQKKPGNISAAKLFLGSCCMALNFGSRPQFMLACFLAFPLFWKAITVDRILFSRKSIPVTIAALIPFAIILPPLLWYNYLRFGSVFNFGSAYNLTGFNMTTYHQPWMLTPLLIYYFLFQPINPSAEFPFIETTSLSYPDDTWAPFEPMFGGFFWLVPSTLLIFLVPLVYRSLKRKRALSLCVLMFASALFVLIADARTAGITQRYFSDFGWYFVLISVFVFFTLREKYPAGTKGHKTISIFMAVSLAASFVVGLCSLFSPERYAAITSFNPALFDAISSLFQ